MDRRQELALAKMIGCMEGVTESGLLGEDLELHFREIIAEAISAFNLPGKHELIRMPPVVQ